MKRIAAAVAAALMAAGLAACASGGGAVSPPPASAASTPSTGSSQVPAVPGGCVKALAAAREFNASAPESVTTAADQQKASDALHKLSSAMTVASRVDGPAAVMLDMDLVSVDALAASFALQPPVSSQASSDLGKVADDLSVVQADCGGQ